MAAEGRHRLSDRGLAMSMDQKTLKWIQKPRPAKNGADAALLAAEGLKQQRRSMASSQIASTYAYKSSLREPGSSKKHEVAGVPAAAATKEHRAGTSLAGKPRISALPLPGHACGRASCSPQREKHEQKLRRIAMYQKRERAQRASQRAWAANNIKEQSQSALSKTGPSVGTQERRQRLHSGRARAREAEKAASPRSPMLQHHEERLQHLATAVNHIALDDHLKYNRERREAKAGLQQFRS